MKIHKINENFPNNPITDAVFTKLADVIAHPAGCFAGFRPEHGIHTVDGINVGDVVCFGSYYALIIDNGIIPFQIGQFWKNLTLDLAIWSNVIFKCNVEKPQWLDSNCIEIDGDMIHFYPRHGDELLSFEIMAKLPVITSPNTAKWTPKD
jgi:hypothetical protein